MCVRVPLVEGDGEYLYLTDGGGIYENATDGSVAICRYWEAPPCEWGNCYAEVGDGAFALDDMVDVVRAELRAAPTPCPNRNEPWHQQPVGGTNGNT